MKNYLRFTKCRAILVMVFLLFTFTGWAQTFKQGVKQGVVKVKFAPTMASSLSVMPKAMKGQKGQGLVTGISSFDQAAKQASAYGMKRLFPFDPKNEHKLRKHGLHLWYVVTIDESTDPKTAAVSFSQLSEVEFAEVEREKTLAPYAVEEYKPTASTSSAMPFNDPMLEDQWHYNNTGQTGYNGSDANVFEAWTTTTGANDIIVSVHDQGVDALHEDLAANMWVNELELNGTDGVDDDGNGYVDDIHGYNFQKDNGAVDPEYHGTHVAGTVAAVNNNGIGVSGVAGGDGSGNGVKIMSLQILGGAPIEESYIYAANNGAIISQNSWGYTNPGSVELSVLDAIDYFIAEAGDYPGSPMRGGIVIFAAGNSAYDADWYPGYYESAFAVAALGPEGKRASYSNYGDWIELSAPGGDQTAYGSVNGVLSTIPDNKYAFMQGTSMACPHVSGIAALVLSNRDHQLVPEELWTKLLTGTVSIDEQNPDYPGKLGTGAIDAALAIQNDDGVAPDAITDLNVTGVAQEFATFSWTVPTDEDDDQPASFTIYYSTTELTAANLAAASNATVANTQLGGTAFSYELENLLGLSTYYFAVVSRDRWGNVSEISNVVSETTNEGPAIAVDPTSVSMSVDATVSNTTTADITIENNAAGLLRWESSFRQTDPYGVLNVEGINYPVATGTISTTPKVRISNASTGAERVRSNEPMVSAYTQRTKSLSDGATNIIGETDLSLPNSALGKFYVDDSDGFNLTQIQMYLKHDPALGPIVVEVFQGTSPSKDNLIYASEWSNYGTYETTAYLTLKEHLFFEQGETFWVAIHVPAGNLFPLGIGWEASPEASQNCFMSFDVGATWMPLEDALDSEDFAWTMKAVSQNPDLGDYLTLNPVTGDLTGNTSGMATITADGSTLINGSYTANLILTSNDAANEELRIPVSLNVSGQVPNVLHADVVNYGSVFMGDSKTIEIVLDNQGYGNFSSPSYSFADGSNFMLTDGYGPWQIGAREEAIVKVDYTPTAPGNANDVLTVSNGTYTYEIALFGVGAETSEMLVTPMSQTITPVALGDVVDAQVTVENVGGYPLKYFIPGWDTKGVSNDWPSDYHSYGYKYRTNYASETNPLTNDFVDISTIGVEITDQLLDNGVYVTLDMGFDFPYYGEAMNTIYVAQRGFTTFDNTVRPINTPTLGNSYSPKGYISPFGSYVDFSYGGSIHYKKEQDRIIIQWSDLSDGYAYDATWTDLARITAQMVLFADGNIRFYYPENTYQTNAWQYFNVLMEDVGQTDGILINNYSTNADFTAGTALGFDYPGPNIITDIQNGSGILMPGQSATVDVTMATESLTEGLIKRYLNIVSNDPANVQALPLVEIDITSGGTAMSVVSEDNIDFSDVFMGATVTKTFTVKNTGTANVEISGLAFTNGNFTIDDNTAATIVPGYFNEYTITLPTASTGAVADVLTINYVGGGSDVITLAGNVIDPPAVSVDLSLVQQTLNYGETASVPFTIDNTGLATMEVMTQGEQWVSFDVDGVTPDSVSYHYNTYNTAADGIYQWIDIRETGTQMPFVDDIFNPEEYWRDYTLPFEFEVYGEKYTDMKIAENGVLSFGNDDPEVMIFNDGIPSTLLEGNFIAPYMVFGGFDTYTYPAEEVGIFYQEYADKVIITWSHLSNFFGGMGDPISAQVFLYKNGTIKFQYKVEDIWGGGDQTSNFASIGIQSNQNNYVSISNSNNVNHGDGLAYILVPTKQHSVTAGTKLTGTITFDAQNVFGGVYASNLNITTNVPGSELLEKPVELTVIGEGAVDVITAHDFGTQVAVLEWNDYLWMDDWKKYSQEIVITNTGSASLDITNMAMTNGTTPLSAEVGVYIECEPWDWFCTPGWSFTDVSLVSDTYTLLPGESISVYATFKPSDLTIGTYTDDLVLTTSVGDHTITLSGTSMLPPAMNVDKTPIEISMNTMSETASPTISIDNIAGNSDLNYDVIIKYGRVTNAATTEAVALSNSPSGAALSKSNATIDPLASTSATYNRTIWHTDDTMPESFVGTGGAAPFSIATKYNAGADGLNLTHVETWFRAEDITDGVIEVEVRAGGSNINNAQVLNKSQVAFTRSGDDESGNWTTLPLSDAVGIYPNEDFYVIVTLPLGIQYPQGIITDNTVAGRYLYKHEGVWYDIQNESGFATTGWLMYAAEEAAASSAWVTISSPTSDVLASGAAGTIDLFVDGSVAVRGDQVADIIITSNDANNPVDTVSVALHMNEAPAFSGIADVYTVAEATALEVHLNVADLEGNAFNVAPLEAYANLTYELTGSDLAIQYSPVYGEEGSYEFTFVATDEYGAVSEATILVEVMHSNQAPELMMASIDFEDINMEVEYLITDLFADPEGDALSYTVTTMDASISAVYVTGDKVLVKSIAEGQTTLDFVVTDSNDASTTASITVNVVEMVDTNSAPEFIGASTLADAHPSDEIEYQISDYFSDPDGDAITFTVSSSDAAVASVFAAGETFLVKSKAEGTADLTFTVTDTKGASTTASITVNVVEVVNTNNAPEFIGQEDIFQYHVAVNSVEYALSDFFSDPDGDEITYTVESSDESVVKIFASATKFLVQTSSVGTATLNFTVTDVNGASMSHPMTVTIDAIAGINDFEPDFDLNVYPNPTSGRFTIDMHDQVGSDHSIEIINTLGEVVMFIENGVSDDRLELDLSAQPSGVYLIKIAGEHGVSVSRIIKK
jgi:subtilisin family serine protease